MWISNDINIKCWQRPFAQYVPRPPIFSMTKNATSVRLSVGRSLLDLPLPCLPTYIPSSSYGSMELTSRARSTRRISTHINNNNRSGPRVDPRQHTSSSARPAPRPSQHAPRPLSSHISSYAAQLASQPSQPAPRNQLSKPTTQTPRMLDIKMRGKQLFCFSVRKPLSWIVRGFFFIRCCFMLSCFPQTFFLLLRSSRCCRLLRGLCQQPAQPPHLPVPGILRFLGASGHSAECLELL